MAERRKDIDEQIKEIHNLYYKKRWKLEDIAKKFECSVNSIVRRIKVKREPEIILDAYQWDKKIKYQENLLRNAKMPEDDRELISEFVTEIKSEGHSKARVRFYLYQLRRFKEWLDVPFLKATKKDMKKAMAKIEGSKFSPHTKQNYKIAIKRFYHWLYNEKLNAKLKAKEYPECVEWISTTMGHAGRKLPEDILNEADVKKLLEHCDNIRNKALVALLWDSGCRIGEVLNIKIKNISFDKYGGVVTVDGKSGSRRVRLVSSVPYLANLIDNHPLKSNPDANLFVSIGMRNQHGRVTQQAVSAVLLKLKKKAGIHKRMNAHAFRHARATFFASRVKEAVMKEMFGWSKGSNMVATYVHLAGRDVDREVLKAQGIIEDEKADESVLKPSNCPRCSKLNEPSSKFCNTCGLVLDPVLALKAKAQSSRANEEIMQWQEEKPQFSMEQWINHLVEKKLREAK